MKFLSLIVLTMLACQNGFADKIFVPSGTAGDATTSVVAPNSNLLDFDWTTNNQAFTQGSTPAFKTVDEAVVFYQNYREMMKKRTMANMVSNFPIAENAWCLRYYDAYGFNAPIEGDRYQFNCLAGHGDLSLIHI